MISVQIGQAELEKEITWSKVTIMAVLGKTGSEAIATISIFNVILAYYQRFAYQRDALKSNYYEVRLAMMIYNLIGAASCAKSSR